MQLAFSVVLMQKVVTGSNGVLEGYTAGATVVGPRLKFLPEIPLVQSAKESYTSLLEKKILFTNSRCLDSPLSEFWLDCNFDLTIMVTALEAAYSHR